VVHNSFKNLTYLRICLIALIKEMLSFTFLKTSKISLSLSSFFDLEELTRKGGMFLKLEFIELGLTFGVMVVVSVWEGGGCFFFVLNWVSISLLPPSQFVSTFALQVLSHFAADTIKRLISYPKCRSVEVINNPSRPGSNHRE